MIQKDNKIQLFIDKSGFNKIINTIIEVINETDPDLQADIKSGNITITKNNNWEHWICSIGCVDDHVSIFMYKGILLKDPKKKLIGSSGRVLRRIEIHSIEEIDHDYIRYLLKQAIKKQLAMPSPFIDNSR